METLFAKYRSYWRAEGEDSDADHRNGPGDDGAGGPNNDGNGDGRGGGDGGKLHDDAPSRLSSEPDLPACDEDPNDHFDDMEDVELAKALGVPDSCVDRMTPVKAKPHVGDSSSLGAPLVPTMADGDRAQWRQKRISDLKSLAN